MSLLYVIDAYNITNHTRFIRRTTATRMRQPIQALMKFIITRNLTGSRKNKVILVCDGYPKSPPLKEDGGFFEVIFSREDNADNRIKRIIEGSAQPKNIVVVSDDREIKFFVRSCGAVSMGVEEFLGEDGNLRKNEDDSTKATYSQMESINKELRGLWLK